MKNNILRISMVVAISIVGNVSLMANPSGGQVVSGSATANANGSTLTVNQTTDKAIINWQSFSIAQGETTKFIQPSSTSAILNRVVGSNLSEIYGTLQANGQVYLINPNGIIFGQTGVINTAGFVASTLDVPNSEFLTGGDLHFSGASTAKVQNLGKIEVGQGDVFLIAQQVENGGQISAPNGMVGLAGGNQVLLAKAGNRLQVSPGNGSVSNTGDIAATAAELKAAGGNMYALAINNGGTIRATGVANEGGRIVLISEEGTVKNTGTLQARKSEGSGGFVETSGKQVDVSGTVDVGQGGLWLLDPNDITINAALASTISTTLNGGGNVTQQTTSGGTGGNGDIFVNSAITWAGTGTLTLDAYRNILINSAITGNNGGLTVKANGTISDTASTSVKNFTLQNGTWSQVASSLPSFNATNFVLSGGTFLRVLGGDGVTSHYQITDVYGLQGIVSSSLNGKKFILANNIDATGTSSWNAGAGFVPIDFSGEFNGNNHVINGLAINRPATYLVGLFKETVGYGRVSNLGLTNENIVGNQSVGGLVGVNYGNISNCYTSGVISGSGCVGGLVGVNNGSIENSHSSATASSTLDYAGGFVGYNNGTIQGSYSMGTATGYNYVGNFYGYNNGTIQNSYSTANGYTGYSLQPEPSSSGSISFSGATLGGASLSAGGTYSLNSGDTLISLRYSGFTLTTVNGSIAQNANSGTLVINFPSTSSSGGNYQILNTNGTGNIALTNSNYLGTGMNLLGNNPYFTQTSISTTQHSGSGNTVPATTPSTPALNTGSSSVVTAVANAPKLTFSGMMAIAPVSLNGVNPDFVQVRPLSTERMSVIAPSSLASGTSWDY